MSLTIKDLRYRYPKNKEDTLNGVSFTMEKGQITTLLGPNGSGKTTLIRLLSEGNKPKTGEILLDGKDLTMMPMKEKRDIIAYLPQENPRASSLTVFEVILLGEVNHLSLKVRKDQLDHTSEIIRRFSLEDIADRKYSELSGGQRRIVNIAQVMSKEPKVLILDEPTANLDVYHEIEVLSLVKNYVQKKNIYCLLVLHSINLASRYSDKICLLKDGVTFVEGTPLDTINETNLKEVYHILVERSISQKGYPLIHILENETTKDYSF